MQRCWGVQLPEAADRSSGEIDSGAMAADRYFLWLVRRIVFCPIGADLPKWSLCRRLGSGEGREAFLALRLILFATCVFGRRQLRLAPPGAAEASRDEVLLLQLVSAAQHGADDLLRASLLWLVDPEAPVTVEAPLRRLAQLLARSGVVLTAPAAAQTSPGAEAAVRSAL